MSTEKFFKHLKSKHKRYVVTLPDKRLSDGKPVQFQADTEDEVRKMVSEYRSKQEKSDPSVSVKPLYDPNTGERIN